MRLAVLPYPPQQAADFVTKAEHNGRPITKMTEPSAWASWWWLLGLLEMEKVLFVASGVVRADQIDY